MPPSLWMAMAVGQNNTTNPGFSATGMAFGLFVQLGRIGRRTWHQIPYPVRLFNRKLGPLEAGSRHPHAPFGGYAVQRNCYPE